MIFADARQVLDRVKAGGVGYMPERKWDDRFYLQAYRLASAGLSDTAIAQRLGVPQQTFCRWRNGKEALANALAEGRRRDGRGVMRFRRAVYDRLPPAAREIWDSLMSSEHDVRKRALRTLQDGGRRVRQQLFLLALVENNFGAVAARSAAGVTAEEFELWTRDAKFLKLLAEVEESKLDFFEGALIGLVAQGEPSAVIFANKTRNRERGYGERVDHDHTVTVRDRTVASLLSGLSVSDKRTMLELLAKARSERLHRQVGVKRVEPDQNLDAVKNGHGEHPIIDVEPES